MGNGHICFKRKLKCTDIKEWDSNLEQISCCVYQTSSSQYASDNTTLILANEFSINRIFRIMDIFEKGTGLRPNTRKIEGLWIGKSAGHL